MSILIEGMEMPEYCYECPCCDHENGKCQLYKDGYLSCVERPAVCPLKDANIIVDKAISAIHEMIESIDVDFPLLDFNSRYMMERGMRMSLIQIKELRTEGERREG